MNKNYHRLVLAEREEISRGIWAGENFALIALRINRDPSTVTREIWWNVKRKIHAYHAVGAQAKSDQSKQRIRPKKIDSDQKLRDYIYEKLKSKWSPEEIAKRIKLEYPKDTDMRISHETIYQHLYCLPKGELKKELMSYLRQKRKFRQSRKNAHWRRQRIPDIISISERPKEAEDRTVPGHWEGDLLIGKRHDNSLGTLVERTTRLTLLVPLKEKNALAVREAFAKAFKRIPKQFAKTLTYDRGSEMSQHKLFSKETKIKVFFADPYSPWQRGTNENTNGLIRQYFPKGTDFKTISTAAIKGTESQLNSRPRKALQFYTPSEKFYELITGQKIALET